MVDGRRAAAICVGFSIDAKLTESI
jgi:hypothetical protein